MELVRQTLTPQWELANAASSPAPPSNPGFSQPVTEPEGFSLSNAWDAAVASFQRENTVISMAQSMSGASGGRVDPETLIGFNPLQAILDDEELGEDFIKSYSDAIDAGLFDWAMSKDDILEAAQRWDFQKTLVEDMDKSIFGSVAGGLAAAIVDPVSYIPFLGPGLKARSAGRVGRIVGNGLLGAGASEAILQSTQDLRSLEESILNIGTAGIISGGAGVLGELASFRTHPLHKDHPNNPLKTENLHADGVVLRTPGEEDVIIPAGSTAGAKQVDDAVIAGPGGDIETADPRSTAGRLTLASVDLLQRGGDLPGVRYIGSMITKAFHRRSTLARRYSFRLMDNGGRLTKDNFNEKATGFTAENIANDHRRIGENLFNKADTRFRKLAKDLTVSRIKIREANQLNRDWQNLTRRLGRKIETVDDTLQQELRQRYGDKGADLITAAAHDYMADIQKANSYFRDHLIKQEFLRDNAKHEKLNAELLALQQKRDQVRERKALQKGLADKGDDLKASNAEHNDEIAKINEDIKRVRAARDHQESLPKDMGEDYFGAQLWDTDTIALYPEHFKSLLRTHLAKNPDGAWLAEEYQLTREQLDDLRVTDPGRHREITEAWSGDEWVLRVTRAESNLKAAEYLKEDADNELSYTLRLLGLARREEGQADLSLARKKRDHLAGERDALRKKRAQLGAEARALKEAATAARTRTLERQLQEQPVQPEAGALEFEALVRAQGRSERAATNLDQAQNKLDADSYAQPNAASVSPARLKEATAAELRMDRAGEAELAALTKAQETPVETTKVPEPTDTPRLAKAEQRARDVAEELRRIDGEVRAAEEKLVKLDEALRVAESRKTNARLLREELKIALRDAKANSKTANSLAGKSDAELKAAYKKIPMETVVEQIYRALASGKEIPTGALGEHMPSSGRLMERRLNLDPYELMEAEKALDESGRSLLVTDLSRILQSQYDDLSGQLAVRESLGGKTWEQVELEIKQDYETLRSEVKSPKERASLEAEEKDVILDLRAARDRILRTEDDGDSAGWVSWMSRNMRLATLARFGSGFGLSSLSDAAALSLRHPIIGSAKRLKQVRAAMVDVPESEMAGIIHATEIGSSRIMSASRTAATRFGDEDLWRTGNPAKTVFGKRVAGAIDHSMRFMASSSIWAGGLHQWTNWMKATAGVNMSYRVRDLVGRYDTLTDIEKADLASTGIGRKEAAKIHAMIQQHGTVNSQKWFEANLELWDDLDAARTFRLALQRDMNRSVVTPGVGDTPRLMSHWGGRLFMMFWSHPMSFTNRFVVPAVQRGILDPRVGIALSILITSSTLVTSLKLLSKGEDPFEKMEKEPVSFVAEVVDRSGVLGYFSQYAMTAGKMAGLWESSRYERSSAISNLFGVNGGLISNVLDVGDTAGAAIAGDRDVGDVGEKMLKLKPYAFFADVGEAFYDKLN